MVVLGMFVLLAISVIANLLYVGIGISRQNIWTLTALIFVAITVVAGFAGKKRWDGVFIDRDNRISLSRFQLVLWTILLVSALFTIGLTNIVAAPGRPPLDITIPPQIWGLLGLGALSAVAAPAIKDGRRDGPAPQAREELSALREARQAEVGVALQRQQSLTAPPVYDGDVLTKQNPVDARWVDLFMGDNDGGSYVDVSKLQQLAFTVLIVTVYAGDIWVRLVAAGHIDSLPGVSNGFLWLLGISHTAYLADKQIAKT